MLNELTARGGRKIWNTTINAMSDQQNYINKTAVTWW